MSKRRDIVPVKAPRVPLRLQEAVRALAEVRTIDDAKFFSDKADALAAWARIYKDDAAGIEARRVKLHAYRRMGQLAEELQPTRYADPGRLGRPAGAATLLKQHGFSESDATKIMRIARTPKREFDKAVRKAQGVTSAGHYGRATGLSGRPTVSDSWHWLTQEIRLRAMLNKPAREVAAGLSAGEFEAARKLALAATEWLDEFDQFLPKKKEQPSKKR